MVNSKAFSFCSAVLATGLLLAFGSAYGAPPGWSTWAQVVEQEAAEAPPPAPASNSKTTNGATAGLVIALGLEYSWSYLHPGGDSLDDTYEAYGYPNHFGTTSDLNGVVELAYSTGRLFELGGHLGFNGVIARSGDFPGAVRVSNEVGAYVRLTPQVAGGGTAAFRAGAGVLLGRFVFRGIEDQYSMPYVRPAICVGVPNGREGGEFCMGWTYAAAADGLGPGEELPFGGLDLTIMVRFAP